MYENILNFEDFISPVVRVIIKNNIEVITNKIYPRNTIFKDILKSEGLNPDVQYTLMDNPIDLSKPIIDLIPKNRNILTELELFIEANILDLDSNQEKKNDNLYFRILRPFEKPFRILSFSPQENNISIKKFPFQTINFFHLENFSCSKSSYCNTHYDLYISGGGGPEDEGGRKNFFKINNIKITIEKLEDLPWEKEYHSMIYIPRKYIYFIGGNNRGTFYYDFINKTFKYWAPLKSKKRYPALVLVNNSIIYAFGQQNKLTDKDFIEKTNIKSNPKWEIINIKISEPFTLRRFGAVLSDDEKIYFVGGRKQKDDKIFFYDIKNNEIDKANQINSAIRISESNFYKLNDFTSILIPQETKGDIRIIIFNRRTKKFRKAKYEKDYDLQSQKEFLEMQNNNEDEILVKPEINFKIIENKYENEFKMPEKEEDLKLPSLARIKKLLLGKKNILKKNVDAMVFNRKRIIIKKSDNIDGEESEREYEENENDEEMEIEDLNNSKEENYEKSINISLRKKPINNSFKNLMDNNETLKDIFNLDENQKIFLNIKNPKIKIEDYNANYNPENKLSLSTIDPRGTNTIFFGRNTSIGGNLPFEIVENNNQIYSKIHGNIPDLQLNKNINANQNLKVNKNEDNNNNIQLNIKKESIIDDIPSPNININKGKTNLNIETNIKPIDINLKRPNFDKNAEINGKIPAINSSLNDLKLYSNSSTPDIDINTEKDVKDKVIKADENWNNFNTFKALTLREIFGRSVDEEMYLRSAKVIVPGTNVEIISGIIGNNKSINKNNKTYINTNIPSINASVNKSNINSNINREIPGLDIDFNNNMNKKFNPNITLKEIAGQNIDDNINLNVKNPKLWGINDFSLSGIIDGSIKLPSADININGPNINIPGININKPNLNISGNIPNIDTSILH